MICLWDRSTGSEATVCTTTSLLWECLRSQCETLKETFLRIAPQKFILKLLWVHTSDRPSVTEFAARRHPPQSNTTSYSGTTLVGADTRAQKKLEHDPRVIRCCCVRSFSLNVPVSVVVLLQVCFSCASPNVRVLTAPTEPHRSGLVCLHCRAKIRFESV